MATDEKTGSAAQGRDDTAGGSLVSVIVSAVIFGFWIALWIMHSSNPARHWELLFTLSQIAVVSVVIWQVCDPFADAAQWVGRRFRIPGSVRGATLDAVASSMPELFSGIFFVVVAVSTATDAAQGSAAAVRQAAIDAGAEGYGSTIATCAGSAIYNMILIPAFCALVISFTRPSRPTIDVDDEVISRDGIWFLFCQILLILFLYQEHMMWWMGVCFLLLYTVYIVHLYYDACHHRKRMDFFAVHFSEYGATVRVRDVLGDAHEQKVSLSATQVVRAQLEFEERSLRDDGDDEETHSAGVLFGYISVRLNGMTTSIVLLVCTLVAATACYFLVEATIHTAAILQVPAFFVAVILAAAASSVPDTFLAIAAARRGDDSGAVSNAFGSNIFDICICLSIPLLVNAWLTGWEPVSLLQDGKPMPGLVGLRILLVVLTIVNLGIMWHNRQITRTKAIIMCGLYMVFVAYAVLGSLGVLF